MASFAAGSKRRARTSGRAGRFVASVVLVVATGACASAGGSTSGGAMGEAAALGVTAADSATITTEVTAMLRAQVQAWNRGDLEAFLAGYTDDPTLAFVGESGVVRGKAAVRESYRTGYFEVEGEPDDLEFDRLEVRPLGPRVALVHGRWTLYQPGFENQPVSGQGRFTLVVQKEDDGEWRIMHDHSS
ncbi:MAG: SgcJ/EcaC family oxidoreductase [Gemmatimonadetes bacterium]|nr:SgcJ/EcaC family oxidoreductase [Gemmatimonadota bacterium]NNF38982.1 SgcJ/EcaC family oxidoreductase [Gemmatimonadota bacterium]